MKIPLTVFALLMAMLITVGAIPQKSTWLGIDRNFANEASIGNQAEVELGELAQEKGASDYVRMFGAMMEREHGMSNEKLHKIMASAGLKPPMKLDQRRQAAYDRLARLSGAEFDAAYRKQMEADHSAKLAKLRAYIRAGKADALVDYARESVPVTQAHLNAIRAGRLPH